MMMVVLSTAWRRQRTPISRQLYIDNHYSNGGRRLGLSAPLWSINSNTFSPSLLSLSLSYFSSLPLLYEGNAPLSMAQFSRSLPERTDRCEMFTRSVDHTTLLDWMCVCVCVLVVRLAPWTRIWQTGDHCNLFVCLPLARVDHFSCQIRVCQINYWCIKMKVYTFIHCHTTSSSNISLQ